MSLRTCIRWDNLNESKKEQERKHNCPYGSGTHISVVLSIFFVQSHKSLPYTGDPPAKDREYSPYGIVIFRYHEDDC